MRAVVDSPQNPSSGVPRPALIGMSIALLVALPFVLTVMGSSTPGTTTPAELLAAIAGLTSEGHAEPPFSAASRLEPASFVAMAQDGRQADALLHLLTEPTDVLAPRGNSIALLEPRGRIREPRPLFSVALREDALRTRARIHLLDLDRRGVVRRIPLPAAADEQPGPGIRSVRPALHGLLPGRYAWWIEPEDPLAAPELLADATANFTLLDPDVAHEVESHMPAADGEPLTRLRRAAVLLCAGLAQEALVEIASGGFAADDRGPGQTTDGDPLEETAALLAAAAWRRLGDLDAAARQISALVQTR